MTDETERKDLHDDEWWQNFLNHPDTLMSFGRRYFNRLPSNPRCQMCAAPFTGWGGRAMELIGKKQSSANPNMCTSCEKVILRHHGGGEVTGTLLFADIRGSTSLAEKMTPTEFHAVLDRFYTVASDAVFANGGIVDKFVGDELVAAFVPMLGDNHAQRAVQAARDLLNRTGHGDPSGPWLPVGAGINTGRVWFGATGEGQHVELTMVGDVVNTTARLAAAAGAGEILVAATTAQLAGLDPELEQRSLELKGKAEPTPVVALHIGRGGGGAEG